MIDTTKYTRHQGPRKFEGESPATEYFYEQMLGGDGEEIYADNGEDGEEFTGEEYSATIFHINAEESEAFDLPIGHCSSGSANGSF